MAKLQVYFNGGNHLIIAGTLTVILLCLPSQSFAECTCDAADESRSSESKAEALKYKLGAIASILIGGAIGVCIPIFGSKVPALRPETNTFFIIKTFAAGVILSTGFIHVLPDAFESLTSPCLCDSPLSKFPFTGFVAMIATMLTLMIDAFSTSVYMRMNRSSGKSQAVGRDEEEEEQGNRVHVHTHTTHGHSHGSTAEGTVASDLLRHRVVSQVLELGIVVHSVIIGISLGASGNPSTVKPLFAAGVILSTGFIHVLPDAFESLTSPCLCESPLSKFPFTGFVAMIATMLTLMIDAFSTSVYMRMNQSSGKSQAVGRDEEEEQQGNRVHVHTHTTHGHSHGPAAEGTVSSDLLRHRVVSQVLELGIVVHSVIIGISLGASGNPSTVKPLFAALTFHQFFEGMGLGGCISKAKFKAGTIATMVLFFSLTTPIGIGIGIGISSTAYNESNSTALILEGIFNAASAGILIYMALVDLLAADFMSHKIQNSVRLQVGASVSLFIGAGCMSLLAIWA